MNGVLLGLCALYAFIIAMHNFDGLRPDPTMGWAYLVLTVVFAVGAIAVLGAFLARRRGSGRRRDSV